MRFLITHCYRHSNSCFALLASNASSPFTEKLEAVLKECPQALTTAQAQLCLPILLCGCAIHSSHEGQALHLHWLVIFSSSQQQSLQWCKASVYNAGDPGLIPALGRSPPKILPWEKEIAIHSRTIAWKIPWIEEPGRLKSMGSQRVGHNWATSLSPSTVTNSHRLDGLNNSNLFHTVLETGRSKVRAPAQLGSGEDPLPGL